MGLVRASEPVSTQRGAYPGSMNGTRAGCDVGAPLKEEALNAGGQEHGRAGEGWHGQ